MTVAAFVNDLRKRGVELWAEGDRLRFSAPAGVVDDALRDELRRRKAPLLDWLRRDVHADHRRSQDVTIRAALDTQPDVNEERVVLAGNERLLPRSIEDLPTHPHPYARLVAPYRHYLLSSLRLDKRFVRGEGCYLFDEHGRRYLDMVAQYGALPFGSNPPEIWDALIAARDQRRPAFVNPGLMDAAGELAQRLVRIAPGDMRHVTFANSGAEAVEVALKLARSATRRTGILGTANAFHGLTLGAMSVTGRDVFQRHFGAPVPGFDRVPYGDLDALRATLAARPGGYAAFVVEPIQGEGGIVVPPPGYLRLAADACREAGVLFIADEVQTGLGRTGAMFACEHEAVTPDILVLAKALGGGLMPIGAVVYSRRAYNMHFDMWHSSTFAGNSLACCAGLAALNLLEADDRALVRRVADNGAFLLRELERLRETYPRLVQAVRGRGYMIGLELALNERSLGSSLLVHMAEQRLLLYLIVAYLLNVEHVRVAPAYTGAPVLRIEPPLIADRAAGEVLIRALDNVLALLEAGSTAALVSHLAIGLCAEAPAGTAEPEPIDEQSHPAMGSTSAGTQPGDLAPANESEARAIDVGGVEALAADGAGAPADVELDSGAARFAFLVHLLSPRDYAEFDPSLAGLSERLLTELHARISRFVDPFPIGRIAIRSPAGGCAWGDLILVPHTAEELMRMPATAALSEVVRAIEVAQQRGADIVGLGGFTSVVSQGGVSLAGGLRARITNGNSYTVATALEAIDLACRRRGANPVSATVAIVGAGGNIGRAITLLMPARIGRMILVGNPSIPQRSAARLLEVGVEAAAAALAGRSNGHPPPAGTLAAHLADLADRSAGDRAALQRMLSADDRFAISTDIDGMLPRADVVVASTNAVDEFIFEQHLKHGAIVCDVSRPFNVCRRVRRTRPDVLLIDGGTVQVAGRADLRAVRARRHGHVPACMAETILLSFERAFDLPGLSGALDTGSISRIQEFGIKHGFQVVLDGEDWGFAPDS